jgi:uncharacterized SAM-binding protein YcdF (DUF218 family)
MPASFSDANNRGDSKRRRLVLLAVIILVIVVIISAREAGRWLVRGDEPAKADVIVVLSGGMPYRAESAAKVFHLGYAPEIWVSKPASPAGDLQSFGIHFVGEEVYNREILVHLGVPESAVHIFPEEIVDTEEEVAEIQREMRRTGKQKVIIVTSPQHTRRVRALWWRLAGGQLQLLVYAAGEDPFDADHWWRNTRDALAVVREYLGLANVWAGMPVRPVAH